MVVEGSAAISIAPLLRGSLDVHGKNVVAVLTGRNLDSHLLADILKEYPHP
jgi:threonine dehydratase